MLYSQPGNASYRRACEHVFENALLKDVGSVITGSVGYYVSAPLFFSCSWNMLCGVRTGLCCFLTNVVLFDMRLTV